VNVATSLSKSSSIGEIIIALLSCNTFFLLEIDLYTKSKGVSVDLELKQSPLSS
jgi:hypothetical protein